MATAEQLKALIESFTQRDETRFRSVAMQIGGLAAKEGKTRLAEEIRALIDQAAKHRSLHVGPTRAVPISRPPRDLAGLIVASYPETRLADMVLREELVSELR